MAEVTEADSQLVEKVTAYVEQYMSHYDGSHDFSHIQRVLALARQIASSTATSTSPKPTYDPLTITLSALLHDVGDKKYLLPGQDPTTLIRDVLLSLGAPAALAQKIQTIGSAVSYSSERRNPQHVADVIARYPELAAVQDADRLDAIGAVGIGRAFTYGGAVGAKGTGGAGGAGGKGRPMSETMEHFEEKLLLLRGLMKTEVGRELAGVRTERLLVFRGWWEEEQGGVGGL